MGNTTLISIKDGTQQIIVAVDDIIWIEAHEQFSYLRLKGIAHKTKKYITKSSLKKLEKELSTVNSNFLRVSKFFIVNMGAVVAIEKRLSGKTGKKELIRFKDDEKLITIGRSYKKRIKALIPDI